MIAFALVVSLIVGALLCVYILTVLLAELLRTLYWAVWCLIPVCRAHPDRVTVRRVIRDMWFTFKDELCCVHYNSKSCTYYSHGYWPWEHKVYFA